MDLTLKRPEDAEHWRDRLDAELLQTGSLRLNRVSDVTALEGFDEGGWWVQDVAASLPVMLLGDIDGKQVFDLCAAPGGKTMQLAARGGIVTAVDKAGVRLRRVLENLERTGLKAETVAEDMYANGSRPEKADAILLGCALFGDGHRPPPSRYSMVEDRIRCGCFDQSSGEDDRSRDQTAKTERRSCILCVLSAAVRGGKSGT